MHHHVHRLKVHGATAHEELERFVNDLEGELVTIVPFVTPVFMPFGGAARTTWLLIVERVVTADQADWGAPTGAALAPIQRRRVL
jgi:hypothetical protein